VPPLLCYFAGPEDPALTAETETVLEPYRERITWDAPIHSVADVEALAFPPRTLNSKPSRFCCAWVSIPRRQFSFASRMFPR